MSEQQERDPRDIQGFEPCEFNCEVCRISYSDIEQKEFCENSCLTCGIKRAKRDGTFKDPSSDSNSSDENSSADEYEYVEDDVGYVEHVFINARLAMGSYAGSYCSRRNEFAVNQLKRKCRKFSRSVKRLNKVVECKEKTLSHFHRELSPVSSDDEDVIVLN